MLSMDKKWRMPLVLFATVAVIGFIWWGQSTAPQSNRQPALTVSAASSLKEVLTAAKDLYVKQHPEVSITLNFGGSGTLSQQIEQGAEVDVYLSASAKTMAALQEKNLVETSTLQNLYGNRLVLIAPKASSLTAGDFSEIVSAASVDKIALGEPKSVPAGQYAEEVFTTLGILPLLKEKAVYGKDVREVLTWVALEHASLGVVYESDAKISVGSDGVKVLAVAPPETHSPIVYPGAVVKASKAKEAATAFLDFLKTDDIQKVFQDHGFYKL